MNYISQINEKGNIAVDDTILVKGTPATAGSRMLENFTPLFSATAVERLEKKGYTISGKTNVGEFGLDLVGEFSYFENDTLKGAAAELVADKKVKAALCVDLNGSPRRAAALSGVKFIKPTYSTVSRYGVIPCASSAEQIGVMAGSISDIKEILTVIAGHDEKDGTSLKNKSYDYDTDLEIKGAKVCIIKELLENVDEATKSYIENYKNALIKKGVIVEEISSDIAKLANSAWQILMCAETCNNLSRYDGVKFGYRTPNYSNIDELYVNTRTEGFNFLTKATIIYGSEALSKGRYTECYDKSLRIRRIVVEKMKEIFKGYDAVLLPAISKAEYKPYDIKDAFVKVFEESVYTAIPSITGMPALVSNKVQLMGNYFDESMLLSLAKATEGVCC
ncbi:MAG: hypothetical protein E7480_05945 [Ruminococcaceae bacterium]|nr:hypothetical protein [Oscillospiraceae bacterium]